jgi:hypothetical protein
MQQQITISLTMLALGIGLATNAEARRPWDPPTIKELRLRSILSHHAGYTVGIDDVRLMTKARPFEANVLTHPEAEARVMRKEINNGSTTSVAKEHQLAASMLGRASVLDPGRTKPKPPSKPKPKTGTALVKRRTTALVPIRKARPSSCRALVRPKNTLPVKRTGPRTRSFR